MYVRLLDNVDGALDKLLTRISETKDKKKVEKTL